ncbi:hypothetical protein [Flavobacterium sp. MK4S-17]|uniref:hypothetical protein n=1 Tax=Flavobacterium sp. MK4S-17 TaxID=2543737 RepID=UPI00135AE6FC|nr:hypothetical protein [Flavobacterium sp. MK4S-17]
MPVRINIVLFGIGNTGSALIKKVLKEKDSLAESKRLDVRFPVITNSSVAFFEKEGTAFAWEANFIQFAIPFKMEDVLNYVMGNNLENLIIVDATASPSLPAEYLDFIRSGFSIVSINETLQFLPDNFEKGIKFLADSHGLGYAFLQADGNSAQLAAGVLLDAIVKVARKQNALAL